jgi:hypothetical protein
MVRCTQRNTFFFVQGDKYEAGWRRRRWIQDIDHEIELAAMQRGKDLVCVRNHGFDCYAGCGSEHFRKCHRHKLMAIHDCADTNSNMSCVPSANVRHFARDIPNRLPKLARAQQQQGALGRQLHPLTASVEKFDLHGPFKARQALAEGGLAQS